MCVGVLLSYACICTFTDLAGIQTGEPLQGRQIRLMGWKRWRGERNDMSITLVKCMITGYEDASGIGPAGRLVLRN